MKEVIKVNKKNQNTVPRTKCVKIIDLNVYWTNPQTKESSNVRCRYFIKKSRFSLKMKLHTCIQNNLIRPDRKHICQVDGGDDVIDIKIFIYSCTVKKIMLNKGTLLWTDSISFRASDVLSFRDYESIPNLGLLPALSH